MSLTPTDHFNLADDTSLDVLMGAVERLSGANDELEVASILRTAARKLTGADGVSVVLKKGDRVHYVDEDAVGPLWKGQDFPIEACISGWAIMNRQTVVISDITGDPRIPLAAYQPTFVKSLAMAPVGLPNPIAAIGAYWATMRRPTDEEVHALETMARAASVALENVRLRRELSEALEAAQSSERAKSAFLANMSREIRTPLNGLATLVELLDRTQTDARQKQLCATLKSSAEDTVQLVCEILDFARLESGRGNFFNTQFDLGAAVRTACAPHALRARERGLSFDIEIAPEAEGIFIGDTARLQQIVDLLAANAVKFTDEGGVTVRIEEEEHVGVRSMFKLSVTDTGLGFDESTAGALFERFTHGATPRGGLGLGLAIADAISRAMGGGISASAESGLGSTFTVRLPLERRPEDSVRDHIRARA